MRKPDYDRRVAVTGLGVISPVGNDVPTAWDNLSHGVSGLAEITRSTSAATRHKAGGEVQDFDAADWMDPKAVRRSESSVHFGVAAGKQALADSGFEITDENREDVGVVFGSGAGGQQLMIDAWISLHEKGPRSVAPTFIANALVDSTSGMIAIETGAIGHNSASCRPARPAPTASPRRPRRSGAATASRSSPARPRRRCSRSATPASRTCAGWACPRPGEPVQTVSRPFDLTRNGFVLGEGAGGLFLEDLELAKARGAKIYAEVVGYGSAADGWDMVQPIEHGIGSARAMKMALDRRGVPADEVDLINPHGTSTPLGDKREAEAIWTVFGERSAANAKSLAISGTKSMTGHMMGAAGAFEAFATVLSVAEQCIPPTINYRDFDPECDLWVVDRGDGPPGPLRAVEQHRPRRPQRRGHLQAIRRRLTAVTPERRWPRWPCAPRSRGFARSLRSRALARRSRPTIPATPALRYPVA